MEPRIQSLLLDDFEIERFPPDQLPFPLGAHGHHVTLNGHASRPAPVEPGAPRTATFATQDAYTPTAKDAHGVSRDQRSHAGRTSGEFGSPQSEQQQQQQQHHSATRPPKSAVPLVEVLNSEHASATGFSGSVNDLLDDDSSSRKRQKVDGNGFYTLPKPQMPVKKGSRRPRIPPLLQGLHQPPPNAGLFPPITGERAPKEAAPPVTPTKEAVTPSKLSVADLSSAEKVDDGKEGPEKPPPAAAKTKVKRKKWTEQETTDLLKGVARFGIGSWKKVLSCTDYSFNGRTAVDLKDRFRTCCPDEYKTLKTPSKNAEKAGPSAKATEASSEQHTADLESVCLSTRDKSRSQDCAERSGKKKRGPKVHRKDQEALSSIGINAPFKKKERRARRQFSGREDEALLHGFEKYGPAWNAITKDPELQLTSRHCTDLRDRFRIRWPDKYEQAGYNVPPKTKQANEAKEASGDENHAQPAPSHKEPAKDDQPIAPPSSTTNAYQPSSHRHKAPDLKSLLTMDPFHDPFTTEDFSADLAWPGDCSPVILPREIFSYANPSSAHHQTPASLALDPQPDSHINPLDTLKIPRPVYGAGGGGGGVGGGAGAGTGAQGQGMEKTNLPPVWLSAPLTAGLERSGGAGGSGNPCAGRGAASGQMAGAAMSAVGLPGPADMLLGLEMGDGRGEGQVGGAAASFVWDELPVSRGFEEGGDRS